MPTTEQRVAGNFLALGGGEIVARLVAFLGTAYAARALGASAFGIVGFALALSGYLGLAITAGSHEIGARDVASDPRKAASLGASVAAARLLLAVAAFGAVGVVALLLDKPPLVKLVIFLAALSFFPIALDTSWVLKGLARPKPVGVALVLGQVIAVGLIFLFVDGPGDVARVPVALFVGEFIAALLLGAVVLRLGVARLDLRSGFRLLKTSGPLAITRVMRTLIFTFDVLLLSFLVGDAEVGVYTASYRICFFLLAISTALAMSYLPAFVAVGKERLADSASHALEFSAWIGLPLVVGGMILAEPILLALFGPEYVVGAGAFRILLASIGILFLYAPIHNVFLVLDRTKSEAWIIGAGALANLVLNFSLIPRYGLMGAAIATVSAETLILVVGVARLRRLNVDVDVAILVRPALLTAAMAVVVALTATWGWVFAVLAGGMAFGGLSMLLGAIPREARPLLALRERARRWLHHRLRLSTRQIEDAQEALGGREYYELYDELYREIRRTGTKTTDFVAIDKARHLIYADIDRLTSDGSFPAPGGSLIDLGSGDGGNAMHLAEVGYRVTGVDVSPTGVEIASKEAALSRAPCTFRIDDVTTLATCTDGSFDAATSFGVLHMLVRTGHRRCYLESVRRVLKPGGVFLLFEFMAAEDVEIEDEDAHILRGVTRMERRMTADGVVEHRGCGFRAASVRQYRQDLQAAGFDVVSDHEAWSRSLPFGMLLAKVAPTSTPSVTGELDALANGRVAGGPVEALGDVGRSHTVDRHRFEL